MLSHILSVANLWNHFFCENMNCARHVPPRLHLSEIVPFICIHQFHCYILLLIWNYILFKICICIQNNKSQRDSPEQTDKTITYRAVCQSKRAQRKLGSALRKACFPKPVIKAKRYILRSQDQWSLLKKRECI